jgi:hypothetical protein
MKHPGVFFKEMFSLLLKKALAYYSERGGVVNAAITGLASGLAGLFFFFFRFTTLYPGGIRSHDP